MKAKQEKPHPKKRTALVVFIVSAAIMLTLALFATWLWYSYTHSYAEDLAKPLEKSLVEAGAVKRCSESASGRTIGGDSPWFSAYYELSVGRDQAVRLVSDIASKNGYNLMHATVENRGPINVSDQYIDDWYYDHSKDSPYKDLEKGKIELAFVINNSESIKLSNVSCGTKDPVELNASANNSIVSLKLQLPPAQ